MRSSQSQVSGVATVIAIAVAVWFVNQTESQSTIDREAMIGTWTDEDGKPGNSIRFYFVAKDIPGAPATCLEGHVTAVGLLGDGQVDAIWNYGGWNPLVLNVMTEKKSWYAQVRKLDDDHILIRLGDDPVEMMKPEAIDHPDTRRLTRIGREPGR